MLFNIVWWPSFVGLGTSCVGHFHIGLHYVVIQKIQLPSTLEFTMGVWSLEMKPVKSKEATCLSIS